MIMNTFSDWLNKQIQASNLTYSEISRRGGPSHARISQVVAGAKPGLEFCLSISQALHIPPERVFRQAGHLPPRIIGNNESDEILDYFQALSERNRKTVLALARTLHEQQTEYTIDEAD